MIGPKRIAATAILTLGGLLTAASAAPAGVIVEYPLNTTSPTDFGPTMTAPGVTASLLTEQGPLQNYSTDHHQNLPGDQLEASPAPTTFPTSVDDAFSKHDTFSFTVTPPAGKAFFLTSLTFNVAAGGTTNGAFIRETGVRSSLTDGLDLYTTTGLPGGGLPTSPVSPMPDVSLSFPVFQNITGPVTFYFAVDTPNGNDTIDFDDIILNGSVGPILPEPTSLGAWVLFGTAGCWCLWRQRRSRRAAAV